MLEGKIKKISKRISDVLLKRLLWRLPGGVLGEISGGISVG